MDNILASGISTYDHLAVFDKIAKARIDMIEIESLLVYIIDTVPSSALQTIAEQFNVMGYKGWSLTTSDSEKRSLIKKAIELHRYKGTPWAIKEALKSVGYAGATIQEHVGINYDGQYDYDGDVSYGTSNWAKFSIQLDLGDNKGISSDQITTIVALINEYKNVRSHLITVSFAATLEDSVSIDDEEGEFTIDLGTAEDTMFDVIQFDGQFNFDGTYKYGSFGEQVELISFLVKSVDNEYVKCSSESMTCDRS